MPRDRSSGSGSGGGGRRAGPALRDAAVRFGGRGASVGPRRAAPQGACPHRSHEPRPALGGIGPETPGGGCGGPGTDRADGCPDRGVPAGRHGTARFGAGGGRSAQSAADLRPPYGVGPGRTSGPGGRARPQLSRGDRRPGRHRTGGGSARPAAQSRGGFRRRLALCGGGHPCRAVRAGRLGQRAK